MKRLNILRKYTGTAFAFTALVVAQMASTQFSYIFYQDAVPKKIIEFNNEINILFSNGDGYL